MIQLKSELLEELVVGGVDAVKKALQQAIELEHSTIPLYLYALYSLDEELNGEIAEIIQSVALEEMLHLTLAANVLNGLGGNPELDRPGFIPAYPGPLPGGVESQLSVQLAPFSMDQLSIFLTIEEPEHPIPIPVSALELAAERPITIGVFYNRIIAEIGKLNDSDFYDPPRHQIGPGLMEESIIVTDKKTAVRAIEIIIDQGEGTPKSPMEIDGDAPAHYYRFQQIVMGKKLIPAPGQTPPWVYGGDAISLNSAGVYRVPTNPSRTNYTTKAQLIVCDTFNYTYTSLLHCLHKMFNGQPEQLRRAIGLMMSLKSQAKAMMSGSPNPEVITGPTFEYQPTNPGSPTM
jgi:hypothetical protein